MLVNDRPERPQVGRPFLTCAAFQCLLFGLACWLAGSPAHAQSDPAASRPAASPVNAVSTRAADSQAGTQVPDASLLDSLPNVAGRIGDAIFWIADRLDKLIILALTGFAVRALRKSVPRSYRLIHYCLYARGNPIVRHMQTLGTLMTCFSSVLDNLLRFESVRDLFRIARLRVEVEILHPRPIWQRDPMEGRAERKRKRAEYRKELSNWKSRINEEFRRLTGGRDVTLLLPNPGVLVRQDTEKQILRYFQALDAGSDGSHAPAVGDPLPHGEGLHESEQPGCFLATVAIGEGFLAPLYLLTGLASHFDEDWEPILSNYAEACTTNRSPLQVFLMNCWLMWGPSVPLCSCEKWRGGVALQYGFGDENKSILVYLPSDRDAERVLASLAPRQNGPSRTARGPALGLRAQVTGRIRWGRSLVHADLAPAQRSIADPPGDSFVIEYGSHQAIRSPEGTGADYYYTAYIWALFELQTGSPRSAESSPSLWRVISPFEHINIADRDTYEFGKMQLARKFLHCVLQEQRRNPKAKFRYLCAFDDSGCGSELRVRPTGRPIRCMIGDLLRSQEFASLASSVCLDAGGDKPVTACRLADCVAEYYEQIEQETCFCELTAAKVDLDLLAEFYEDLYVKEFPNPDERESLQNMTKYLQMKASGWYGLSNYHIVLLLHKGRPVAGSISDYLHEPKVGIIEFLVVDRNWRRSGLGRLLLRRTEQVLTRDAPGERPLEWIVAEMEDPYRVPADARHLDPFARARVWHKWGYRKVMFPYVQPALSSRQRRVEGLTLIAKSLSNPSETCLPAKTLDDILREYFRLAMRIHSPERNEDYQEMKRLLDGPFQSGINLVSLERYVGDEDFLLTYTEVAGRDHPDLQPVLDLYDKDFPNGPTKIPVEQLRRHAGRPAVRDDHRYHLWALKLSPQEPVAGMVSFFTLKGCGFGGYLLFSEALRKQGQLPGLIARIEQRMIQDACGATGWYAECEEGVAHAFTRAGFWEIDVAYLQPPLAAAAPASARKPAVAAGKQLRLLYKPFGESQLTPRLACRTFLDDMRQIFRVVYGIEKPDKSPICKQLAQQVRGMDTVRLIRRLVPQPAP